MEGFQDSAPEPAAPEPPRRRPSERFASALRELLLTLALAAVLFLGFRLTLQNFRVVGSSMEPTIRGGDYLLVNKLAYLHFSDANPLALIPFLDQRGEASYLLGPPERGDMVVFHSPSCPTVSSGEQCIKRVIGLPGDTVKLVDGRVYVNGQLLREPYPRRRGTRDMEPVTVPEGSYFVMGDNRPASYDSRDWGPVEIEGIVGKALVSYWPPEAASVLSASPPPRLAPAGSGSER